LGSPKKEKINIEGENHLGLTQKTKRGKKEEELGKAKCRRNLAS
jgi:hypothetical protein